MERIESQTSADERELTPDEERAQDEYESALVGCGRCNGSCRECRRALALARVRS